MPEPKFRLDTTHLYIQPPDHGEPIVRPVRLIYDSEQCAVGVMFIGEGEFRGYSFYLSLAEIDRVVRRGRPAETVELPI
jgi:hypothetical protein